MNYIGIDLGGTKISGAIFTIEGKITLQKEMLLEGRTGMAVGDLIVTLIRDICSEGSIHATDAKSIGICVPGIAYSSDGHVWCPNIPDWDHFPLRDVISENIPNSVVTIESDRTCYILGETTMGMARGCRNAVFIAVGTGIGAGILIDDKVLHGYSDIVGAIGWLALKPPYDKTWDQCGCFETHCSGEGLATQAHIFLKEDKEYDGELRAKPVEQITSYDLFKAYDNGDPLATRVFDQAIEMWGMAAANLVSIFNPEMVILAAAFSDLLPDSSRASMKRLSSGLSLSASSR
jgi:Transcriptional regulator/sugar kinase